MKCKSPCYSGWVEPTQRSKEIARPTMKNREKAITDRELFRQSLFGNNLEKLVKMHQGAMEDLQSVQVKPYCVPNEKIVDKIKRRRHVLVKEYSNIAERELSYRNMQTRRTLFAFNQQFLNKNKRGTSYSQHKGSSVSTKLPTEPAVSQPKSYLELEPKKHKQAKLSRSMMMPTVSKHWSFGNVKSIDVVVPEIPKSQPKNKPYLVPKSTLKFNYDFEDDSRNMRPKHDRYNLDAIGRLTGYAASGKVTWVYDQKKRLKLVKVNANQNLKDLVIVPYRQLQKNIKSH